MRYFLNTTLLFCFLYIVSTLKAQLPAVNSVKSDTIKLFQDTSNKSIDTLPVMWKLDTSIANKYTSLSEIDNLIHQKLQGINIINDKINTLKSSEIENFKATTKMNSDSLKMLQKKIDSLNVYLKSIQQKYNELDSLMEIKKQISHGLDTDIDKKNIEVIKSTKKNDSLNAEIKKADTTLAERQASIAKQLDSLETIAKIEMVDTARIFYWKVQKDKNLLKAYERPYKRDVLRSAGKIVKIEQINITVKEGIIVEVIVKTDSAGIYRNSRSVDDLLHLGKTDKAFILFHEHQKYDPKLDSSCIFFDDILNYTPIRSYNDVVYGDFDIMLTPTKDGRYYLLRESTSINTYFNIAAFTDIKGISGEPNGLAQFTAEAKFITNTQSLRPSAIVPFNYIAFRGGLSKFDNDFQGAELKNNDSISRKDLLQRANYSLGIKLNIFKWFLSPRPKFLYDKIELNTGFNFLGTKVFDTSFKDVAQTVMDTTYSNVTQNQWYIEPIITFNRHRNFSMTLAIPFYFNNVKHNATINPGIKNNDTEVWAAPGISLMYFGKRDVGSKIFFRYNNYINLKDKTQSFTQMQLGYSLNLTEIWSGTKGK